MKRILFIVISILIICSMAMSLLASCGKPSANTIDAGDIDGFITDTAKYYRTEERNFDGGRLQRMIFNQEALLYYGGGLIFKGIYLFDENYTLEYEDELYADKIIAIREHYTYYKFLVTEVFKGDKALENTEIYLIYNNLGSRETNNSEVVLQQGEEYFMFVEHFDIENIHNDYKENYGVPPFMKTDYRAMLIQGTFPVKDNYVYASEQLIDYDNVLAEKRDNAFMNEWVKQQIIEKTPVIPDKDTEDIFEDTKDNTETTRADISKNEIAEYRNDLFEYWQKKPIATLGGEMERICIPIDTFTDFLKSAIEYYDVEYYDNYDNMIENEISLGELEH